MELTGKILRIEVDSVRPESNKLLNTQDEVKYSVPSDNPFRNITEARGEIYALGVKNMWRCSIDRGDRHTGKIIFFFNYSPHHLCTGKEADD